MRHLTPALLLLAAPAVAQTTWHVPGDAATIQAGLGLAFDGDTVLVGPGVHAVTGNGLDFDGKAITLASSDGPEATILDGANTYRLVRFRDDEGPDTVLEGFTLRNGSGPLAIFSYPDFGWDGGAILMEGDASPTIRRCVFVSNSAGQGGKLGDGSDGGDATDKGDDGGNGTDGKHGLRGGHGGAIYVEHGDPLIEACVFWGNAAGNGGSGGHGGDGGDGGDWGFLKPPGDGGDAGDGGSGGSGGRGGAIATRTGYVTVANCLFLDNRSGTGGIGGSQGIGGQGGDGTIANPDGGDEGANGANGWGGSAGSGGALAVISPSTTYHGAFRVTGCTFVGNSLGLAGLGPGGLNGSAGTGVVMQTGNSEGFVESSILWGNGAGNLIQADDYDAPPVRYSNVVTSFGGGWPGEGNIAADPLFTSASPKWKGYALQPGSPCIDAGGFGSGTTLPASAALFELTGHLRAIDDPASPDTGAAGQAIDMGAREYVPPAQVEPLAGCGGNPAGSLTLLSGAAQLGGTLSFGIDNPLGTQAPGSLAFLSLGFGDLSAPSGCGVPIPGFGMAGGGAPGELLIDLSPGMKLWTKFAGLWTGPGQPAVLDVAVTTNPGVLGLPFFVQGGIFDPAPAASAPIGLTEGLRLVHGQ